MISPEPKSGDGCLREVNIDPEILPAVLHLQMHGIETFSSCQGGAGHSFDMPHILFHGDDHAGLRAVWLLEAYGFHLWELSRHWHLSEGAEGRPYWQVQMRTLKPSEPLAVRTDEGQDR